MLGLGYSYITQSKNRKPISLAFSNIKSVSLDGVDDYVTVPDDDTLDVTSNFTASIWVYLGNMDEAEQDLAGVLFEKESIYVFFNRPNTLSQVWKLKAKLEGASGNGFLESDQITEVGSYAWANFVVSYKKEGDGSDELRIYQNGSEIKSVTNLTIGDLDNDTGTLQLGRYRTSANVYFFGKLDEFALWNETLDADAISAVYNSGVPFDLTEDKGNYDEYTDGLVCYLRVEGHINDSSGNGNNASALNQASIATAAP